MSYIHEALKKAQKERNGHYPNDSVKIAKNGGITMKSSWLTATLFFMLISFFVAIIIYSWFKTQQQNQIQLNQYTKKTTPNQPVQKKDMKGDESNKLTILKKNTVHVLKEKNEKQTAIKNKTELLKDQKNKKTITKLMTDDHKDTKAIQYHLPDLSRQSGDQESKKINRLSDENQQDKINSKPLGPDQFLEVTRLYKKGLEAQVQKKFDRAMSYYKECLDISPHMAPTLNNMGVILFKQKRYFDAEKYFLIAIEESPEYVDPYYNLACLFSQKKDVTQAIEYLKKAVRLSEDARNWAITDKDFEPLYELPEFNMIIAGYNL